MDPTTLGQIAKWAEGSVTQGDALSLVTQICTDSRTLKPGDLFFALRGENFDGHAFIRDAAERGALAAVVEEIPSGVPSGFSIICVDDVLLALQRVASSYRKTLPITVINVTGSNGKTSTKDLTAGVLGERFQVSKTEGNFNNHIGLPLTILRASSEAKIGVWEIGMNHPGEIAPLAAIASPDIGIITNIGVAHIEHLGSREAIAQEKGELAAALRNDGFLILSADDDFSSVIRNRTKATVVTAGIEVGDVQARGVRSNADGMAFTVHADGESVEATLPVLGHHMVKNAVLAVAAGRVLGLSLEQSVAGLKKLRLTKGRLEQKTIRGIRVLDDTYNANPDSMSAALQTLAQIETSGRRIAVLGRMGELGTESEAGHRRVGAVAAKEAVDCVIGVGAEAKWITESALNGGVQQVLNVAEAEEAVQSLRDIARSGDVVLVKGSRSARMERIVEGMKAP